MTGSRGGGMATTMTGRQLGGWGVDDTAKRVSLLELAVTH